MRYEIALAVLLLVPFTGMREHPRKVNLGAPMQSRLEQKLDQRIGGFDTAGCTFVGCVTALAYCYELPTAIEYVDRDAAHRTLNLKFHDPSVREVLEALAQQTPEYRLSFSEGLVDVYSPRARADDSNVLNRIIRDYKVTGMETRRADFQLFCELGEKLGGKWCGGSLAIGQWEPTRISLHLQNAKAYEVINAIVAQNGSAIWTVTARPDRMSKIQDSGSWYVYPLEPAFQSIVVDRLERAGR
ncbi:MAG TPA: hypothetical protein VGJ06_01765 [Candidatus Acidoferrum sp.]|jgi:hypothetical protein